MAKRTPEEIDAMEKEVRDYRVAETAAARKVAMDHAKPLCDLIADGAVRKLQDAIAALDGPAQDRDRFPTLRAAMNAATVGLDGLVQVCASLRTETTPTE
jgi:hypothetical protein